MQKRIAVRLSNNCQRLLKRVSVTRGVSVDALVNAALARSLKVDGVTEEDNRARRIRENLNR